MVGWSGLTPVAGRAEQAWPYLFSGSWGSSSAKPLTLYLVNMVGGIQEILNLFIIKILIIFNFYNYNVHCHRCLIMTTTTLVMMMMGPASYQDFVKERTGQMDKPIGGSFIKILYLPTHPPCDVIVAIASSQDNGVSCIRNPTCTTSTMF